MSEKKYTPGPWTIREETIGGRVAHRLIHAFNDGRGHKPIATMSAGFTNFAEDARLISAAPDLLEACKAAVAALSMNATFPADIVAAKTWLNAAITKATGEKP